MEQQDLKAVYFGYFDKLPEPWRSQAKANYNPERYQARSIVDNLADSLECAFDWGTSPQGYDYWSAIRNALLNNWNYLPILPTDTSRVYEVASYNEEDGSEYVGRCIWNGDSEAIEPRFEAAVYFLPEGDNDSLFDRDLTPYAWRPVPPVSIPPRPVNP